MTIFWLQIIDDVSVQKSGKIKLRGVRVGLGIFYTRQLPGVRDNKCFSNVVTALG